jgi:hypothetical protein
MSTQQAVSISTDRPEMPQVTIGRGRARIDDVCASIDTSPSAKAVLLWRIFAIIGALTLITGWVFSPDRAWGAVLLSGIYILGLALGGLFMVATHHVTGAGWSVVIRRLPEALAGLLPAGLAFVAAVLLLRPSLYAWTTGEEVLTGFKGAWLQYGAFLARAFVYGAVWLVFAWALRAASRKQDAGGDIRYTRRSRALSAVFLVCFGVTVTLAAFDWIMTLEHHWYSTIYGVYVFCGAYASAIAAVILLAQWLRRLPAMRAIIKEDHLHDLGKLLLGAVTLWAYIWFSQYMLLWYANIPEGTAYLIPRTEGAWAPLHFINPIINWVIPFLLLLPRASKRDGVILGRIAFVVLLGHWVDLYMLIFPAVTAGGPTFGLWEIGVSLGACGVTFFALFAALRRAPIVPLRDPYLEESLNHHQ